MHRPRGWCPVNLRRRARQAFALLVVVGALTLAASPSHAAQELTVSGSPDPAPSNFTIPMTELPETGALYDPMTGIGFGLVATSLGLAFVAARSGIRARRAAREDVTS